MLDKFECNRFFNRSSCKYTLFQVLILSFKPLFSKQIPLPPAISVTHNLFSDDNVDVLWFSQLEHSLDGKDLNGSVRSLDEIRSNIINMGYDLPKLSDICLRVKKFFPDDSLWANMAERFYIEMIAQETGYRDVDREIEIPGKMVVGFAKVLLGFSLILVPNIVVKGVGGGLVLNGVNEILDETAAQSDRNAVYQKQKQLQKVTLAVLN